MLPYYLNCKNNTESKGNRPLKNVNGKIIVLSNIAVCN